MVVDKSKYDSKGRLISNVQNKEAARKRREAAEAEKKKKAQETETVFRDEKGNLSGITTREGDTYLGLKPNEVQQINQAQQEKYATPQGAMEQQVFAQQQQQAMSQELERQQVAGEVPQRVELNPIYSEGAAETTPLVGSLAVGLSAPLRKVLGQTGLSDEEMQGLVLTDVQKKELEKGISWSEALGAAAEAIPGVQLLQKWNILDVETPRGNLEEVHSDIQTQYRRISTIESNVKTGLISKEQGEEQIKAIEEYVNGQEARLKLLITNSPSLNFNSDRVNSFESDILRVREKIQVAKLNIVYGKESDPTALDLYLRQQQQAETDWATSPY